MARLRMFAFALLLITGLAWYLWPEAGPADDGAKWLQGHAWASHYPKTQKDLVRWLVPMKVRKKRFGIVQVSSHFRYAGERYVWRIEDKKRLVLYFQQSGLKTAVDVRTWECKGEAPKPFELCLELKRGKRRALMYSKKSWTYPREEGLEDALMAFPDVGVAPATDELPEAAEGVHPLLIELGL